MRLAARSGTWNRDGVILFAPLGESDLPCSGHRWRTSRLVRTERRAGESISRRSFYPMAVTFSTTCEASRTRGVYVGQLDEIWTLGACSIPILVPCMPPPGICCSSVKEHCLRKRSIRSGWS